jgi:hypothetical protein
MGLLVTAGDGSGTRLRRSQSLALVGRPCSRAVRYALLGLASLATFLTWGRVPVFASDRDQVVRAGTKAAREESAPPPSEKTSRPSTTSPVPVEAKRIRVRTSEGQTVVARVHGQQGDKISVMLPDGQLGFSQGLAETDEPFQPATIERMSEELTGGPFGGFQVLKSTHYLVLYKSTPEFARASTQVLENLYKGLVDAFRKRGLPVHDAEFPLVAVIFRTESDFRRHRKIDPDVQAYYEVFTNRIYFYQHSERDQQSPEVSALRKPQTVAHEGTHQILQNIGIHPRLSPWPLWLVEGLAEYCASPVSTRHGANWGGIGKVNALNMATIRDLEDPLSLQVKGANRPLIGRDPRKAMVEYLVTRIELSPTDYALAWALTHFLAQKREGVFLGYLKTMSQLDPLEERTPEQQLALFRDAFGADLGKIDRSVNVYLNKLKYDPLPYYAVMFEQPLSLGRFKRAVMVSQSPTMIQQWLDTVGSPEGGPPTWQAIPHPTRTRALLTAEQWIGNQ